jgi:prepilin-type processing-associated H-X9-DG protein
MKYAHPRRAAFTLMELLVMIAVIGVIAALILPVLSSFRKNSGMSREVSAARQLMTGYNLYAAEHDGELLPGYGDFPAFDENGDELSSPVNFRYPWRIAPYVQYDLRLLWGNTTDDRLSKLAKGPRESYVYAVSVQPALGINAAFVGGDYTVLPPNHARAQKMYGQFCVTRSTHAANPQDLIVFASAGAVYEGNRLHGYFKVEAPNFTGRNWANSYSEPTDPAKFGNVDFRWSGKAVAAMLDGHVELLDFEQINDMRRWSNQASTAMNPDWRLGNSAEPPTSSSGDSGGGTIDTQPKNEKP